MSKCIFIWEIVPSKSRRLVFVETGPVHRNHYILKLYHHKLWLILLYFLLCIISMLWFWLSPFKPYIQMLFRILKVHCELFLVYMPVLFWVTFVITKFISIYTYAFNILPHSIFYLPPINLDAGNMQFC